MNAFEKIAEKRSALGVAFLNKNLRFWPKLLVPINFNLHRDDLFGAGKVSHFRISMANRDTCLIAVLGAVLEIGKGRRITYEEYKDALQKYRENRYKDGIKMLDMTPDQAIAYGFQINLNQDPRTGYGTLNKIWWPKIREAVATAFE